MGDLLHSGLLLEIILGFMAIEAVFAVFIFKANKNIDLIGVLANLAAGLFLVVAMYCIVMQWPWQFAVVALLAALCAHGVDVWLRWKKARLLLQNHLQKSFLRTILPSHEV